MTRAKKRPDTNDGNVCPGEGRGPGRQSAQLGFPMPWAPAFAGVQHSSKRPLPTPKQTSPPKKVFPTLSGRASLHPALSFGEQKDGRCPACECSHDRTCRGHPAFRDLQIGALTGLNFPELWNIAQLLRRSDPDPAGRCPKRVTAAPHPKVAATPIPEAAILHSPVVPAASTLFDIVGLRYPSLKRQRKHFRRARPYLLSL